MEKNVTVRKSSPNVVFTGLKGWMRMAGCSGGGLLTPTVVLNKPSVGAGAGAGASGAGGGTERHHYSCKSYGNKLLTSLHALWTSEQLCDVELIAGDYVVKAHRSVLAAASAYFHAMFTSGLSEERQQTVIIKTVAPHILSSLVKFIYTGEVEVSVDTVQELVVAADMMQVSEVVLVCANFLKKQLCPANAMGMYRFAEGHNLTELRADAWEYLEAHFPEVAREEEFLDTPLPTLLRLLQSEHLRVNTEHQVFCAALRWLCQDGGSRRRFVFDILTHVRFVLIPTRILDASIAECSDASVKVALTSIQRDLQQQRGSLVTLCVQPRLCARKKIYVIGGAKREFIGSWTRSECTLESGVCLDTFTQQWQRMAPMTIGRIMPGIAVLKGKIYLVGGEIESQILANGEVYDPLDDVWTDISSMVVPRCEFGLCAHDGFLYAFGGWVGEDIGGSIERYDPALDAWTQLGNMLEPRFSMGVLEHEGLIYIVGGCTDSQRHRNDLISYNPVTDEWTPLSKMMTPRSRMAVAVLDGHLYAVGGTNKDVEVLTTVEKYSFAEDTWEVVRDMSVGRASPAIAATNNQLYVIGGDMASDKNDFFRTQVTIESVEAYDPHTNSWQERPPLPESRSEAGAAVF